MIGRAARAVDRRLRSAADRWLRQREASQPAPEPGTVSYMLAQTAQVSVVSMVEQRRLLDALFPPPPPLTGWKLARQQFGDRVSNTRTRLALLIAPWLDLS